MRILTLRLALLKSTNCICYSLTSEFCARTKPEANFFSVCLSQGDPNSFQATTTTRMKYCAQSALTSSWKLSVLRPCSLTSTGTISFKSWLSIVHPNSAFGFCLHSAHPSSLRSARTRGEHMRFKSSLVLQLHKVKRTIFCWTLKGQ